MLRDKRTLFTTILLPIVLYPVLIIGFNALMSRQTQVLEQKGAKIALIDMVKDDASKLIADSIRAIPYFQFPEVIESAEKLYDDKELDAVLWIRVVPDTLMDSRSKSGMTDDSGSDRYKPVLQESGMTGLNSGSDRYKPVLQGSGKTEGNLIYQVELKFDKASDTGRMLKEKIDARISSSEKVLLMKRVRQIGADESILRVLELKETDTSTAQKKMGSILGMILPYLLIMLLVTGAAVVASDLVAGEKERKTLETLLVSSAGRNEIVLGKYLTIISFAMVNVVINLFSLFFSVRFMMSRSGLELSGLSMPVDGFVILLLALIPLATLFAAILLSISTFSRNMKESRSYEQPLMLAAMFSAMITFFPAIEISNLLALVPVVNIALLFKAVMINEYQITHLLLTIGSTLVLDIIAIWITIRLFNSENVLFRSDEDSSLKNVRKEKRNLFNPFYGVVYFMMAIMALYYIGGYLQQKDLGLGIIQTQIFIIGLPVYAILKIFRLKEKEILRYNIPRVKEIALVPFIAISAAVIVAILTQVIDGIFPIPEHYLEKLNKLFQIEGGIYHLILVVAVMPGIFEEILFRGFIIRFFEGQGQKFAIFISALLFAAFHLDPFRFLPAFLLGLLLGYLTLRSGSIFNSMLSHTINNALLALLSTYGAMPFMMKYIIDGDRLHYWLILPALLIFGLGIYSFHKVTKDSAE